MRGKRRIFLAIWVSLVGFAPALAFSQFLSRPATTEEETAPWQEEEVVLPTTLPREEDLLPFYVSETTPHRFFVDGASIRIGGDGVVRYVLVVQSAGGARNVSFEGIRCASRERRLYATLAQDGHWRKARLSSWQAIENKPMNRQHAALARDHFCPDGVPVANAQQARESLLRDARLAARP